jgi:hypothetical protein
VVGVLFISDRNTIVPGMLYMSDSIFVKWEACCLSDDVTGLTALYLHYTGTAGVLVHYDKEKINLRCDNLKLIFFLL